MGDRKHTNEFLNNFLSHCNFPYLLGVYRYHLVERAEALPE